MITAKEANNLSTERLNYGNTLDIINAIEHKILSATRRGEFYTEGCIPKEIYSIVKKYLKQYGYTCTSSHRNVYTVDIHIFW